MNIRFPLKNAVITLLLTLIIISTLFSAPENWDYFRCGGRDIHAIAQQDSLLLVATDIGLVSINIFTNEKEFIDLRDGLPYQMISSISFDTKGNTWFGSGDDWIYSYGTGVLKYDGINWEVFNEDNTDMFQKGVWAVYVDSNDILWVGGGKVLDYMLFSYDGTNWTRHYAPINKKIYCFEEDDKGNLWIGTADGLLKYDGITFTLFDPRNSPLRSVHVQDLLYTNEKLWMALSNGVECLEDTTWTFYDNYSTSIPHRNVRKIVEDHEGNIWIGSYGGIAKFNGDSWIFDQSFGAKKIRELFVDSQGDLWAGTNSFDLNHGLYKRTSEGWKKYSTYTNDLPNDKLHGVRVDSDNNKWFGTGIGLVKYDGLHWQHINSTNSALRFDNVRDIELDNSGMLWVANTASYLVGLDPFSELVCFNGTSWDSVKLSECGLGTSYVYSFAFSPLGDLWIATNRGAASYNGNSWINYTYENNTLPHNWVYSICPLGTEVWFGTHLGLVCLNEDGITVFDQNNSPLPHTIARQLLHDGEKLWICTEGGVATFDGENWETYTLKYSIIPPNYTHDIQLINGDIWLATSAGAFRFKDGNWESYTNKNSGILNNSVCGVAVDTFNNVWLPCYEAGISIYNDSTPKSAINTDHAVVPQSIILKQNYPNPFNPLTTISYQLSTNSYTELAIYDIKGRKIATLVNEYLNAGEYEVVFDAAGLSSGIYIARLNCKDESISTKMLLMK